MRAKYKSEAPRKIKCKTKIAAYHEVALARQEHELIDGCVPHPGPKSRPKKRKAQGAGSFV
jgi:hypothetical protein